MEKYLVPAPPASQNPNSISKRFPWRRSLVELNGKFDLKYRRDISSLLMQSYAQVGAFPHTYHVGGGPICRTHLHWIAGDNDPPLFRLGVSALEFDSKGIYLASVTKSGCLTVHDFDELLCQVNTKNLTAKEDETKQVLHISKHIPLDVVRWNIANQDEVACASRESGELYIYDIGYVSSEPVEILRKRHTIGVHGCVAPRAICDIAFSSNDKTRVLASDTLGVINVWDRRMSNLPCLELTMNSLSTVNSIKFNVDNQVIFGATQNGMIHMWDIRGGSSFAAFQNNTMAYYYPITSVKLASELEKIGALKAQSNITSKEILFIDLNPSSPYQLAFHCDDGWSGVFDIHSLKVTHVHCPPPPWLNGGFNDSDYLTCTRKPSWLPIYSIYAVGSSYSSGIHLLDFYQDHTSPCHVEYDEELKDKAGINGQHKQNIFIPLSEAVTACAAHPIHGAIVAGTKRSSLLLLAQESIPCLETDNS